MSKAQLLQVLYKEDQGLTLQWKFTNPCTNSVYLRHVIVLLTEDVDDANSLLRAYLKKIKPGDFFYVMYFNEDRELRHVGWKEKPVVDQHPSDKPIIRKKIGLGNKQWLLQNLIRFHQDFKEPIVVSFLVQHLDDLKDIEERITKARYAGKFDFMVASFSPVEKHKLSFSDTVSSFSISKGQFQQVVEFFLTQVYSATLIGAKLTIECLNGSITSMANTNWKTPGFTTIERTYYGPSLRYEKDILCLYNKNKMDCHQQLLLKLQFVTLERRKFKAEKAVSVRFSKEFYQNTFNMYPYLKSYHAGKDIWLTDNPYTTFTVIKFQGNDEIAP